MQAENQSNLINQILEAITDEELLKSSSGPIDYEIL